MRLDTNGEFYLERNDMDQIWFEFLGVLCAVWSSSDYNVYTASDANRIFMTCRNVAADEFWTTLCVHMCNKRAEIENIFCFYFVHPPNGEITEIKKLYPAIKVPSPPPYGIEVVTSFNRLVLRKAKYRRRPASIQSSSDLSWSITSPRNSHLRLRSRAPATTRDAGGYD
ncbi:MAG: hypothetical protein M1836_006712 [Candelina mexicana]|nr:MAG: hypothetical protein M1836_006712 [Candelina mexicana]